jgi:hypothetical protein
LQKTKNPLLNQFLLLIKLIILQLSNNIKFENKYFLNIIKKKFILVFSYFISSPNFLSNKKRFNNILLKNCLSLELPNI